MTKKRNISLDKYFAPEMKGFLQRRNQEGGGRGFRRAELPLKWGFKKSDFVHMLSNVLRDTLQPKFVN